MRPRGTAAWLEARRRALRLLDEGRSLHDVADLMSCAASSVMRWRDAWTRNGDQGLRVRSSPGRPPKLTAAEQQQMIELLRAGPGLSGYATGIWTTVRIAEVVGRRFGVTYHPDHISRLLHALGWTHHRPPPRADGRAGACDARTPPRPTAADPVSGGWTPGSVDVRSSTAP